MENTSLLQKRLSREELKCIPFVVTIIKTQSKGKEKPISNNQIATFLSEMGFKMFYANEPSPRIRKMISHIRINGLIPLLCANSKGYFITKNIVEFDAYLDTFKKRVDIQIKTLEELKKQRLHLPKNPQQSLEL